MSLNDSCGLERLLGGYVLLHGPRVTRYDDLGYNDRMTRLSAPGAWRPVKVSLV